MKQIDTKLKEILADPKKRRSWVMYQLHMQGKSLAQVGKDNGVNTRQSLYETFRKPYPRVEKVIADAVDLTPQQLFPERYDADGLPNRPMGRRKKSIPKRIKKSKNNCNVKKAEAA